MMEKEDLKLIASLGDWSDERMGKVFYSTYVKVLEKKFEEYEERKTQLKDFVQRNYGNIKLPKTPKRMNPAAKLFEQRQAFRMVNFDSDESDDTPVNTQKSNRNARIPTQILQQLQNVGLHEDHQTPNLRKHKVPLGKQISGPRAPPVTAAVVPPTAPRVTTVTTASSTATLSTAASSTVLSVQSSATRANAAGGSKILDTYKKEQQQMRLKERELAAERHRLEILNDKKERVRREREERQLRVEANNRLKMAEQQKREQEQREQEERLRVYQLKQKEAEKCVRSPAAKTRKMGTPRSLRKPAATAAIIQQTQVVQKQQPVHTEELSTLVSPKASNRQDGVVASNGGDAHRVVNERRSAAEVHRNVGEVEEEVMVVDSPFTGAHHQSTQAVLNGKSSAGTNNVTNTQLGGHCATPEVVEEFHEVSVSHFAKTESRSNAGDADGEYENADEDEVLMEEEMEEVAEAVTTVHTTYVQQPSSSKAIEHLQATTSQRNAYDMTPDKVFLPSTKDNYNVDDLSSADETDSEENPRKEIPSWAKRPLLMRRVVALRGFVTEEQRERHFGRIAPPNINDFFSKYKKEYAVRSSSAVWDSPMSDPTPGIGRYCA